MKTKVLIFVSLLGIIGGLIWLIFGSLLASTPPAVPGVSYRNASDFNPTSGTGTLLLGIGMVGVLFALKHKGKGEMIGSVLFIVGSLFFFIGTMFRIHLNGGFEPLKPIGFLLCLLGLFIFTFILFRKKSLPKYKQILFLICFISLLLFNDQYLTAWSSVPFGLSWIIIHIFFIRHQLLTVSAISKNDERINLS
jgi:hypothetical protein